MAESDQAGDPESQMKAKIGSSAAVHMEAASPVVERKLVIRRGRVSIPDGMYLTHEETLLLEELSDRF
jgi:hypothetical protein